MSDLSRRNLLKRLGVGTAVAWSAPTLASVGTPMAMAQTTNPCTAAALRDFQDGGEGFVCTGCFGSAQTRCGTGTNGLGCFCHTEVQRECCACVVPRNCPGQGSPANQGKPCNKNADCTGTQTGWICVYTCCTGIPFLGTPDNLPPGFKGVCLPPCPQPGVISASAASSSVESGVSGTTG